MPSTPKPARYVQPEEILWPFLYLCWARPNLRRNHRSLLEPFVYENGDHLLECIRENVIQPAEDLAAELRGK